MKIHSKCYHSYCHLNSDEWLYLPVWFMYIDGVFVLAAGRSLSSYEKELSHRMASGFSLSLSTFSLSTVGFGEPSLQLSFMVYLWIIIFERPYWIPRSKLINEGVKVLHWGV